jgi:predicted O-linked N-acetylglucosamine transferase (SPINDLY family)
VIPFGEESFYHERVFRLPRCYFVTDSARALPACASRREHGLPDDALVLASLNQSYKLTRPVFALWMDALREAPAAVLWLYASERRVQANLRSEASRYGVAGDRLVFAGNVPHDVHVARVGCADLALDTLPVGSHTTGVDALSAGVPLLTCRGSTFAGRVGASLLHGVGLSDLITESLDDYGRTLVDLVRRPDRLREYALHLEQGRQTLPLWDTRGFASDLEELVEDAYRAFTT